jgi:glucose-1-phosphate thymidylyltransferase
MKGVVLAGGKGTRLHPLTRITNKHLLPIYDRPMVTYAVESLVGAGVREIMLVTGGTHAGEFFRLLGDGREHGIERLFYAYQEGEGGIAEALGLAARFVADDRVAVVLADNIFERSFRSAVESFEQQEAGARILLARIDDPRHLRHLGVAELDGDRSSASSRSLSNRRVSTRSPGSTSTTPRSSRSFRGSNRPDAVSSRSRT